MKTVLDVSNIIYGGHLGAPWSLKGFPLGGIRKLFGIINAGLSQSEFVLCFDGCDIIKKELLPTYKAGRIPDYSVLAQIDLLKEMLLDCDIPFYQDAKYEADDYIYSLCSLLSRMKDFEDVTIYSDDRDLSCCVTDNVSIKNVTSNGICISRSSYEDRVVRNEKIPYNTILLHKIFHGDSSDNYKALRIPGANFEAFSHYFTTEIEPLIESGDLTSMAYADFQVFELLLDSIDAGLSQEQKAIIHDQARIAYPMEVDVTTAGLPAFLKDVSEVKPLYKAERRNLKIFGSGWFNRKKFDLYCSLMGLNKSKANRMIDKESPEALEFFALLEQRAKELSGGVMAVERYRSRKVEKPQQATLANMNLPL